jgi:hypothetical protein
MIESKKSYHRLNKVHKYYKNLFVEAIIGIEHRKTDNLQIEDRNDRLLAN